eukprot:COSAG05_NODE_14067_length_409_cov_0.825806_1_plen_60_part_10
MVLLVCTCRNWDLVKRSIVQDQLPEELQSFEEANPTEAAQLTPDDNGAALSRAAAGQRIA